jgi:SAM-dependent methyltransferase
MQRQRLPITDHLLTFGIRRFDSDEYWAWGGRELGVKKGMKLEALRDPIVDGKATGSDFLAFYDFIADKKIAAVVHSMKADAIAKTGSVIDAQLPEEGVIVDLGCSIGYLSMYFALGSEKRHVIGIDISRASVRRAKDEADRRKIKNVTFIHADYIEPLSIPAVDRVTSCQSLFANGQNSIASVAAMLNENGSLLCVEPIPNKYELGEFVTQCNHAGLLVQRVSSVFHTDLGHRQMYTFLEFSRRRESAIDLKEVTRAFVASLG